MTVDLAGDAGDAHHQGHARRETPAGLGKLYLLLDRQIMHVVDELLIGQIAHSNVRPRCLKGDVARQRVVAPELGREYAAQRLLDDAVMPLTELPPSGEARRPKIKELQLSRSAPALLEHDIAGVRIAMQNARFLARP